MPGEQLVSNDRLHFDYIIYSGDPALPHRVTVRLPGANITHSFVTSKFTTIAPFAVSPDGTGTFFLDCQELDDAASFCSLIYLGLLTA